jgi:hypothetical protein
MSRRREFIFICLKNFHANIQLDVLIYRISSAPKAGSDTPPGLDIRRTTEEIFTSKRRVMINSPDLGLQQQ